MVLPRALAALLFACLCACQPGYAASAPVVPLLTRAGEVAANARVRPGGPARGTNASLAVAPSDHTRIYGAVQWARFIDHGVGQQGDSLGRVMKQRSDATQGELGAGWGTARKYFRSEVLAGMGYGRVHIATLDNPDQPGTDTFRRDLWLDGRARMVRAFVQGQAAVHFMHLTAGGGLRLSEAHFKFDQLFGQPSQHVALLTSFEPFALSRFELAYVSFDFMFFLPILLHSTRSTLESVNPTNSDVTTRRRPVITQPLPSFYFGLTFHLDGIWRERIVSRQ